MSNELISGFKPIYDSNSEILILGSFPSVASRKSNFYYGNPRNKFWETIAKIYNENLPKTIEEKIEFLYKNKIALWDIVESCDIVGSADTNIKNFKVVNLSKILAFSKIFAIICNGKKSYEILIKNYNLPIKVYYLPSTSPANVSFSEEKWVEGFKKIYDK